ncbi:MAG: PorP/SprF family type IX secretion system membrane protein [Bacteroidales bacterium]|nr:PorP/SprF family type IX secretion system membrane protein [Bacteroidales bacterium]MBN2817479.1 PorP/SprF family type IX secretion system membrane protein [Bacteroidales bacterium]
MRIKIFIILLFIIVRLSGQEFTLPSQINRNLLNVNPAYAGYYETTVLNIMHRSNFMGAGGRSIQEYQNAEFHAPLKKQSIALGMQLKHEQIAGRIRNEVFFDYSHRIELGNSKLGLALKAGGVSLSTDPNLSVLDINDPVFSSEYNSISPNFGFGVSYYSKNYYAGISVPYLLGLNEIKPEISSYAFILTGGGKFEVTDIISIEPYGGIMYSMSSPVSFMASVNSEINELILFGAGYKYYQKFYSDDALTSSYFANLGLKINPQISLLYSFEYNTGKASIVSPTSHEAGLFWYFGYKVNTQSARDF